MDEAAGTHVCAWSGPTRKSVQDARVYLGILMLLHLVLRAEASSASKSCEKSCFSGTCVNGTCVCDHGWVGDQCQHCQGRFK